MFFEIEVEFHQDELLQIMSGEKHGKDPGDATDKIVQPEFFLVHGDDAGDDRGKGPDDGQKTGKDDGFATVFVIELFGLIEMSFFEQEVVFPVKKVRTTFVAEPIAYGIPKDTAN